MEEIFEELWNMCFTPFNANIYKLQLYAEIPFVTSCHGNAAHVRLNWYEFMLIELESSTGNDWTHQTETLAIFGIKNQ